ncbi:hypothetical protein ACFQYP_55235 [Nonomuraea antimicrobica]
MRSLAGALLGRAAPTPAFAAKLHERTAGVPFVIEEVVRSLLDGDGRLPEPGALDRMPVPVLLGEAMAERLTGLSSAALRAVHAAAVLGLPAEEPLINAVSGGDPAEPGLSQALQAGVLLEQQDGQYGFRHALARQAVYDAIPGPDRRLIHRRAMSALAALDPPPLVQLAHHARRAGDVAAWQRHGSAAADHAAAIGDIPLAVELLEGLLADPKLSQEARARWRCGSAGSPRSACRTAASYASCATCSPTTCCPGGPAARPGSTWACCCPTRRGRSPRAAGRSWPRCPTWPTTRAWPPAGWRCWRCRRGAASRWPCTRSGWRGRRSWWPRAATPS